jgi:hypothetical protein
MSKNVFFSLNILDDVAEIDQNDLSLYLECGVSL